MENNLEVLFKKIITDKKLFDEFMESKNLDDMYKFAIRVQDGYTIEKFKEFLIKMINWVKDKKFESAVRDEKLANVSGGASTKNKTMSLALAALMAISCTPMQLVRIYQKEVDIHQRYRNKTTLLRPLLWKKQNMRCLSSIITTTCFLVSVVFC